MRWRRPRAGRYAEARYRLLRSRYRRRVLPKVALVLGPITVALLVISRTADGWVGWTSAVWFGAALGFWCYAADAVPPHIQNWATGAEGERRTERALRPLERAGWRIVHDLDAPGAGNLDHVAVGPAGVFLLDSKAWGGVVTVDAHGATITPRDNPDAAWTATGLHHALPRAASRLARALAAASGQTIPAPGPVVVVWAAFPQQVATYGPLTYVAGPHLADWLHGQPRALNRDQLAAVAAAVHEGLLTPAA